MAGFIYRNIKPEIDGFNAGWKAGRASAQAEIEALKKEIEVLRQFGNKDCTAMADEYLDKGE